MKILRIEKDNVIRELNTSNADLFSCKDYGAINAKFNTSFGVVPFGIINSGAEHVYIDDGSRDDVIGYAFVISEGSAPDNLLGVTAISISADSMYSIVYRSGTEIRGLRKESYVVLDESDYYFVNMCYSHYPEKAHLFTVSGSDLYNDNGVEV